VRRDHTALAGPSMVRDHVPVRNHTEFLDGGHHPTSRPPRSTARGRASRRQWQGWARRVALLWRGAV